MKVTGKKRMNAEAADRLVQLEEVLIHEVIKDYGAHPERYSDEIATLVQRISARDTGSPGIVMVDEGSPPQSVMPLSVRPLIEKWLAEKEKVLQIRGLLIEYRKMSGEDRLQDFEKESRRLIEGLEAVLPEAYAERVLVLQRLGQAFREKVAILIEPYLNAHAKTLPHGTYEEKKALAKWVNAELRSLGLTLKDPKTGGPCHLVGNTSNRPGVGRFMLNHVGRDGRLVHGHTSVSLPHLEVLADDLTRAPLDKPEQRSR